VLQGVDVVGVEVHRLQVPRLLLLHLLLEALGLILRVVELGEAVGDLAAADEKLEAVGDEGVGVVAPGQGRHLGGIGGDEGGILEPVLHGLFEDLDLHLAQAVALLQGDLQTLGNGLGRL